MAWEIAVLEEEVVRKELHLLSLYRAAFDQYLGVSPRASALVQTLPPGIDQCSGVLPNSKATVSDQVEQEPHRERGRKITDEGTLRLRNIKESAAYNLPTLSDSKRV